MKRCFGVAMSLLVAVSVLCPPRLFGATGTIFYNQTASGSALKTVRAIGADGSGLPLGERLFSGAERTSINQAGDGVEWHPTRNEVVTTFRSNIPTSGNLGAGESEGTVIMVFAASGLNPFLRKLTTPTGRSFVDFTTFVIINEIEQDYAPAISRDGSKVAYVRNTLVGDSRVGLGFQLAKCSIRIVNYDGSGDQEVTSFGNQLWVTKLAWAPDDAEIAFDLAPRLVISGLELQMGDPARSEIYIMRVSDRATRLLAAKPAAFPTWSPLNNAQPPQLRVSGGSNQLDLEISNVEAGNQLDLEYSSDLTQWTFNQTFTASGSSQKILINPSHATRSQFFRIRVR